MKPIKMSAVITINFLFIFIFIVSGCEKKNTRTELGFVPSEITWEENEYYATDTILGQKDVGNKLLKIFLQI